MGGVGDGEEEEGRAEGEEEALGAVPEGGEVGGWC